MRSFSSCYNIQLVEDDQTPITAAVIFLNIRGSMSYSKKAELWSADNEEFLYVLSIPASDTGALRAVERSCAGGGHGAHPCGPRTYGFLYYTDLHHAIPVMKRQERHSKKCRIYKSFHFSLHGWMDHHTALVELSTGQIDGNLGGRHTAKILKKVLYSQTLKGES